MICHMYREKIIDKIRNPVLHGSNYYIEGRIKKFPVATPFFGPIMISVFDQVREHIYRKIIFNV